MQQRVCDRCHHGYYISCLNLTLKADLHIQLNEGAVISSQENHSVLSCQSHSSASALGLMAKAPIRSRLYGVTLSTFDLMENNIIWKILHLFFGKIGFLWFRLKASR